MTDQEAEIKAARVFGEHGFAETDGDGRYYVGVLPTIPGPYRGYMGRSYEEAFTLAINDRKAQQ